MNVGQPTKLIVYLLIVVVSLAILYLMAVSPPDFLDTASVYQGF